MMQTRKPSLRAESRSTDETDCGGAPKPIVFDALPGERRTLALGQKTPPKQIRCLEGKLSTSSRGGDVGCPTPPLPDRGGRFSRTGLFKSTCSRMRQTACSRSPEVQQRLAETQFRLARHFLPRLFHNARSRHLETFHQAVHRPPRLVRLTDKSCCIRCAERCEECSPCQVINRSTAP